MDVPENSAGTARKKRRVPWHVTLFALCAWACLLGAWPVGALSGVFGLAYLAWPRIAARVTDKGRVDR